MTIPTILALVAHAGTGKTTVAQALVDGHGWRRVSFAEPLKRAAAAMLALKRGDLDLAAVKTQPAYPGSPLTVRDVLEYMSHGILAQHPGFFADLALREVAEARTYLDVPPGFVIDDLRFPWEVEALFNLGGPVVCVAVEREGAPEPDPRLPSAAYVEKVKADPRVLHMHMEPGRDGVVALARRLADFGSWE